MNESFYVCIHIPEFPAQALTRLRPDLAQTPVVILTGNPPLEQVCSYNRQAGRLGVTQAMSKADLDDFIGLCILRRSEAEERFARTALLEAMGAFTPRLEMHPCKTATLTLVLDMTGTTRIYGHSSKAINNIAQSLQAMHFHAQLASSANPHTAICVARSAHKSPIVVKLGQERDSLSRLPLSALDLTPAQAETLSLWGLHTLGDLAEIPEVELVVRLGQEGKRLRLLACGEHRHLMVPEEPVFVLEEFIAFDAPVELLDSLLFVIGPMLDQLLARAQNRALILASVMVKLVLDGGGEHKCMIKPALPVGQREVLLKLLHLDLQRCPPLAGVLSVFVHAEPGDRSKVQLGLFAPQLPDPLRLDITLARVAAIVGEQRVGRAKLLNTHRTDSFTMERFVVPARASKAEGKPRSTAVLRRCRPPVPISVRREEKRLVAFLFRGKQYAVQEGYGPWRKSGQWWSAEAWSHDEWDVNATAGPQDTLFCVLTYDLLRKQWQMNAIYD